MPTIVTFKGSPVELNGTQLIVGDNSPDFRLTASDLSRKTLSDFQGKRKILNIVPSLDTPTCQASAKRFNQDVAKLNNTVVLVVSADLPFASKRFCGTEGLEHVVPLSIMDRHTTFMKDYAVEIATGPLQGLTARAVIVIDEHNKVIYTEYVSEIANEPNYENALSILRNR